MTVGTGFPPFEDIETRVEAEAEPTRRVELLLISLADTIKSTSNDQNVQRLSRELRAAADHLARVVISID